MRQSNEQAPIFVAPTLLCYALFISRFPNVSRVATMERSRAMSGSSCPTGSYDYDPGNGTASGVGLMMHLLT